MEPSRPETSLSDPERSSFPGARELSSAETDEFSELDVSGQEERRVHGIHRVKMTSPILSRVHSNLFKIKTKISKMDYFEHRRPRDALCPPHRWLHVIEEGVLAPTLQYAQRKSKHVGGAETVGGPNVRCPLS